MKVACDICEKVKDVDRTSNWLQVNTSYSKFLLCDKCEDKFWNIFKKKVGAENDIREQIQIVEDNLKEYGVCDITIEEFNYLKDELYSDGCLAGIELGKAEAINEIHTELNTEIAMLNEEDMTDVNLYTFAVRIKEITDKLIDKRKGTEND